jgi:hypothetical protein
MKLYFSGAARRAPIRPAVAADGTSPKNAPTTTPAVTSTGWYAGDNIAAR